MEYYIELTIAANTTEAGHDRKDTQNCSYLSVYFDPTVVILTLAIAGGRGHIAVSDIRGSAVKTPEWRADGWRAQSETKVYTRC